MNKIKKMMVVMWGIIIPLGLFAQQPQVRWIYIYNSASDANDEGLEILYGLDGNIYIGGTSGFPEQIAYVISLTSEGQFRWFYPLWGGGQAANVISSMAYGWEDTVFATGYTANATNSLTCKTAGTNGMYVSYAYFQVTYGNSIAYGSDGNLYVAIGSQLTTNPYWGAFIVISYTPEGVRRWIFRRSQSQGNSGLGIVYGLDDNIYACGSLNNNSAVISFTPNDSTPRWIYTGGSGTFYAIVYGADGNIYVTGPNGTTSLTSNGDFRWHNSSAKVYSSRSIIYGTDGNLYGIYTGTPRQIWSLTTDGQLRWVDTLATNIEITSITYGLDNNIYVAGGMDNYDSLAVLSFDASSGELNWIYHYYAGGVLGDLAYDIVYGLDGYIYVTGHTCQSGSPRWDLIVISLNPTPTSIEETKLPNPQSQIANLWVYPNPFQNHCVIKFQIPNSNLSTLSPLATLKIYDVSGRVVKSFNPLSGIQNEASNITWNGTDNSGRRLPPGLYFVRLETGGFRQVKEVILVR